MPSTERLNQNVLGNWVSLAARPEITYTFEKATNFPILLELELQTGYGHLTRYGKGYNEAC